MINNAFSTPIILNHSTCTITCTSTIKYYISDRYILYERYALPGSEYLDTLPEAAPAYCLLDMQTGLQHNIDKAKTQRTVVAFDHPGKWEVAGKVFEKYEKLESLSLYGCDCQKVQVWEKMAL